ncbi:MAG: hypothetical protein HQK77_08280 [Desulfobacterales bacterium]|nr:hypothetical protein [Desulfobacterales bacterium]
MKQTTNLVLNSRNIGLDYIRAMGLLLMMSIHYARFIPEKTKLVYYLKFIGESSPAFFFFAFGMTLTRFLEKEAGDRFQKGLMFLYVALLHNLLWHHLFYSDFLFFLWAWLFIIAILEIVRPLPNFIYMTLIVTVLGIMVCVPSYHIPMICKEIFDGPFKLIPWGCFILSGLYFKRRNEFDQNYWQGILIIGLGLFLYSLSKVYVDYFSLKIIKWPLTPTYFLLFIGLNILMVNFINNHHSFFENQFRLPSRLCNFISSNLLLATAIQFFVFKCAELIISKVNQSVLLKYDVFFVVLGVLLCNVLLLIILKWILVFWKHYKYHAVFRMLRENFHAHAIGMVFGCAVFSACISYFKLGNLYNVFFFTVIIIMHYFCLEMAHYRFSIQKQ